MYLYDFYKINEEREYRIETYFEYPFHNSIPCRINVYEYIKENGINKNSQHVMQVKFDDKCKGRLLNVTFAKDEKKLNEDKIYEYLRENKVNPIREFSLKLFDFKHKYPKAPEATLVYTIGITQLLEKYGMDVQLFSEEDLIMNKDCEFMSIAGWVSPIAVDVELNVFTQELSLEIQKGIGSNYDIVDFVENATVKDIEKRVTWCQKMDWNSDIFGTARYPFIREN